MKLLLSLLADPRRQTAGLALVLPGIEGFSIWNRGIVRGLAEGGFPGAIEIFDWTRGRLHWLDNLQNSKRHAEQAGLIVERVIGYRTAHPNAPLWLLGHSGGGGMTLLSLIALHERAPDVRVTGGILLNPAISRSFPLDVPLAQTERGLWNFCTMGDMFFLMLGTSLFGTIDRQRGCSAGALGFLPSKQPVAAPPLTEVRWRPRMLLSGHPGGHLGVARPRFVRDYVAPILMESVTSDHSV
ncbi:MAG: hypothetical protein R3C01_07850 [Planctomycetaceae bacterium]